MSDHLEPAECLRKVTLTPDEFRCKAVNAGWKLKTILTLLEKPYPPGHFAIGDAGEGRVLARIVGRGGE